MFKTTSFESVVNLAILAPPSSFLDQLLKHFRKFPLVIYLNQNFPDHSDFLLIIEPQPETTLPSASVKIILTLQSDSSISKNRVEEYLVQISQNLFSSQPQDLAIPLPPDLLSSTPKFTPKSTSMPTLTSFPPQPSLIQESDHDIQITRFQSLLSQAASVPEPPPKKKSRRLFFLPLILFFLPFLIILIQAFLFRYHLLKISSSFAQADFQRVFKHNQSFSHQLAFFHSLFAHLPYPVINLVRLESFGFILEGGLELNQAISSLEPALDSAIQLSQVIFTQEPLNQTQITADLQNQLSASYSHLSLASSLFISLPPEPTPFSSLNQSISQLKTKLPSYRSQLEKGIDFIDILPEFFAYQDRRTYLVLLQNSAELRPTGGFIGSVGFLTFDHGRFYDFQVQDVYALDGQLKGHINPPTPLKQYLNEPSWFLRDSNWDPSFPQTAQTAQWFLQKEIGRQVDGVIGFNLIAAQSFIKAFEPIYLPDYNLEITAKNFFEQAEFYVENDFFPGSTQKQDFLGSLATHLYQLLPDLDPATQFHLLRQTIMNLEQNQILISLNDPELEAQLAALSWNGQIQSPVCPTVFVDQEAQCHLDYLMPVEANLGVNKSNYYVDRQIFYQLNLEQPSNPLITLDFHYQNRSPDLNLPGGIYKNYLRLLVPLNSRLISAEIKTPSENQTIDVSTSTLHSKTVFAVYFEVPPQESVSLKFKYRPFYRFQSEPATWALYFQHQPGTQNTPLSVSLSPQDQFSILHTYPEEFNLLLNSDSLFAVQLEPSI